MRFHAWSSVDREGGGERTMGRWGSQSGKGPPRHLGHSRRQGKSPPPSSYLSSPTAEISTFYHQLLSTRPFLSDSEYRKASAEGSLRGRKKYISSPLSV